MVSRLYKWGLPGPGHITGNHAVKNSQRFRKEGNSRFNTVSAMKPGLAKIIEKVRISWYFESPEIDRQIAENTCYIDYADTGLLERVHWLSKSQSPHRGTSDYGWRDTLELNIGVARAHLPITGIHMRVAPKSKIQRLAATPHNTRWMDDCQLCYGSIEAIPILDPVDIDEAYHHIASRYLSVQKHVRSHGSCYMSFG